MGKLRPRVPASLSNRGRPKDAVLSLIKRLAHRNANVQLYTLEVRHSAEYTTLANILARQCSLTKLRQEDAPGTVLEVIHRCYAAAGRRPCKR